MNDLRVPTIPVHTEIRYFHEEVLTGKIFLPTVSHQHAGAPRPDEWLNQHEEFFPCLIDASDEAVILNKQHVMMIVIPAAEGLNLEPEPGGTLLAVEIDCSDGVHRSGMINIELPGRSSRLQDFLNHSERFIPLWNEQALTLLNRSAIVRVHESKEV